MNKKYIIRSAAILSACFSIVFTASAQDITDDADIKIEGLPAGYFSSAGVVYDGGGTDNTVKLIASAMGTGRNVDFQPRVCGCFGSGGEVTHDAVFFANGEPYNAANYPYIQIEPDGDTEITHVLFKVYNTALNVNVPIGYGFSSKTGTALLDADFSAIPVIPPFPMLAGMSFTRTAGNTCVSAVVAASSSIEKIPVPEDQQTVRIAASKQFPATAAEITGALQPWYLLGIYIWTNGTSNPNGIAANRADDFRADVRNNELTLSEPGTVRVFSGSGATVKTAENVRSLPLDDLPSGLYIVKAVNAEGKTAMVKAVR
jgi:hypothetical protein